MVYSKELQRVVLENLDNNYQDNYDYYTLGKDESKNEHMLGLIDQKSRKVISIIKYLVRKVIPMRHIIKGILKYDLRWNFSFLYNKLVRDEDRALLIILLAYKILGYRKVKLPDSEDFFETIEVLEKNFIRQKIDLTCYGFPICLYGSQLYGTYCAFLKDQYQYLDVGFKIDEGDFVIDGGACTGDTALLFAHKVGKNGKVFAFEMMKENIKVMNENFALNKGFANRIEIIENPMHEKSNIEFFVCKCGAGSYITTVKPKDDYEVVKSISIDDFLEKNSISKVDFIKMDIEGAEFSALRGAEKTIKKFRPKLAISVYHKIEDFDTIPRYIDSLGMNYNFYLKHHGIISWETVLYCK